MIEYYKPTFIKLISQLQALRAYPDNAKKCLELQESLIQKITYVERRIRAHKSTIKNLKRQLSTKQIPLLNKSEADEIRELIQYGYWAVGAYRRLLYIFRSIGDGLPFIYMDRWDIKPMSFKESSGFLSGKRGVRLERKVLRKSFESGAIAILNDLTNCLRYGDLFIIKDAQNTLVEVKSGRHENEHAQMKLYVKHLLMVLLAFYTGELSIFVIIDTEIIRAVLASEGLAVVFNSNEDEKWALRCTYLDKEKSDEHGPIQISRHFFLRVPYE